MNKKRKKNHTNWTIDEKCVIYDYMSKNTISSFHERWMFRLYSKNRLYCCCFLGASLRRIKREKKNKHRPFENRQSLWKVSSFFSSLWSRVAVDFFFPSRKWNGSRTCFTRKIIVKCLKWAVCLEPKRKMIGSSMKMCDVVSLVSYCNRKN